MSCSRKSSTTSHGNSWLASISAARGAIRSRASDADELAELALLVAQRVPGHAAVRSTTERRSRSPAAKSDGSATAMAARTRAPDRRSPLSS